jgi:hypothetical protein
MKLEKKMMLDVEGGIWRECMTILPMRQAIACFIVR